MPQNPGTYTTTGGEKVQLVKGDITKMVDPGAVDYFIRKGGYTRADDFRGVDVPPPPVSPNPVDPIVGGSDRIREDQQVVRTDAEKILGDLDSVQRLRQTTANENLTRLQDIMERTNRLMAGDFTSDEQSRIDAAEERVRQEFAPAISRAQESARQGTAKATVFGGERGGFMNTQFAGQAALTPTQGDTFVGRGGEISRIKGQLEQNIAILESEQARAVAAARDAARDAMVTGSRQSLQDALSLAEAADQAAKLREDALSQRINLLNQMEEQERARVEFAQGQGDRAFEQLSTLIEAGADVPEDLQQQIESAYGTDFIDQYRAAQEAATQAETEQDQINAMDKITQMLARVPEGQQIQIGDATYEGFKTSDPNTRTFSETDAAGNVTYITVDERTGEIISSATGGRIGKPMRSSGGGGGGSSSGANMEDLFNEADALRKELAKGDVDWGQAWNRLKAQFPQADNGMIDAALGGSAGFDPQTGEFDPTKATGFGQEGSRSEEENLFG